MQLLGWGWKNTACRQNLVRGRLQRASGFSNAVILAAVRTECTRVIRCRKNLADRLARVDWLPEGKRRRRAAFCRLSELASRVSVDKVAATRWVERNRSYLCRICKTAARCFLWFLSNHSSLRTPILRRGLRAPLALARGLIGVPMRCKWRWPLTAWGPRGKMEARLRCET